MKKMTCFFHGIELEGVEEHDGIRSGFCKKCELYLFEKASEMWMPIFFDLEVHKGKSKK